MMVAAYQAPLGACQSMRVLPLIREQVDRCESAGVEILCCPEAVLGGLADYSRRIPRSRAHLLMADIDPARIVSEPL